MIIALQLIALYCLTALPTMRSIMISQRRSGAAVFQSNLGATPPLSGSITTAEIESICTDIQTQFRDTVQHIEQQSSSTWEDTFAALSCALGEASEVSALVTLPSMTHGDGTVRATSTRSKDELKKLFDETFGRPELYKVLDSVVGVEGRSKSDQHFASLLMGAFRRNGCALEDPLKRKELLRKRSLIEETCSAFTSAINENTDSLTFSKEELEGVTDLEQYPTVQTQGNGCDERRVVPLKAPYTAPILQFAKHAQTRKAMTIALAKKCQEENTDRFTNTLRLRHDCANLLGYPSHSHFMLETKMAGNPDRAENFLLDLLAKVKDQRDKDLEILSELKEQEEGPNAGPLESWDVSYYIRVHKATLGVDEAELKKYFPLDHVQSEILSIYEELLGLSFHRMEDAEVWHPDVECYAVTQAGQQNTEKNALGYFYFDIFPREGKYSHQCVYPLRPSYQLNKKDRIKPACANIGNLSRGTEGQPSMLRFREVETFFHEFGHVMHCVLTKSEHSLQAWAWSAVPWPGGVEQDFLEVPSMMLENFVWQLEILGRLSKSPTMEGCSLPESMMETLSQSRHVMEGYSRSRYLAMALYDLKVHSGPGPYLYNDEEHDSISLYNEMMFDISGVPAIPNTFPVASWYHPMMGYDAGYYSYIWSETLAADLFSKFEESGTSVVNRVLGEKYRDAILAPCAMLDGDSMLEHFLGRKSSNKAFLKRIVGEELNLDAVKG